MSDLMASLAKLDLSKAIDHNRKPAKANRTRLITDQNVIWIDFDGKTQYVNLMPIRYVRNLRRWMAKRAEMIQDRYIFGEIAFASAFVSGMHANDEFDLVMSEVMGMPPRVWLREQPLYRQLLIREWRARGT